MKVTYMERVENHKVFGRKNNCYCGSHEFQIVEQLEPITKTPWSVRCTKCGRTTLQYDMMEPALGAWKSGRYDE